MHSSLEIVQPNTDSVARWVVMVVDDEPMVHEVTKMVLKDFEFQNRGIELVHAYSGKEAKEIIAHRHDVALILLDVVMESDYAGLEVVEYIRKTLNNQFVRIVLRTGQSGQAPENKVIIQYDINDYRDKTEMTAKKLLTTVVTSIRAYNGLRQLEQLIVSNDRLEARVKERTSKLQDEIAERLQVEKELIDSQEKLQSIVNNSNSLIYLKDASGRYLLINNYFEDCLALNRTSVIDHSNGEFSPPEFLARLEEKESLVFASGNPMQVEIHSTIGDTLKSYLCVIFPLKNQNGDAYRVCVIATDVTDKRLADAQMRKLSMAVEQTADIVMITNNDGIVEYVNPSFEAITGYLREDVLNKTPSMLKSGKQNARFYQKLWSTLKAGESFNGVFVNRKKNGTIYYEEKTISPLRNSDGEITHYVSTGKDITQRIESRNELRHMANHDALTGLPNRTLLEDKLKQALARVKWREKIVAVMFIDLDRFKYINDSLGHKTGDLLLIAAAERLKQCAREGDTVARLGGDEFAVVLTDVSHPKDVTPLAKSILNLFQTPFSIDEKELFISASIGISLSYHDASDSTSLLQMADVAMYRAKSLGKNNFQFHSEEDVNRAIERLNIETKLQYALQNNELQLYYQPRISFKNHSIGVEALMRWISPDFGVVSPLKFIPLLEELGLIVPVGYWAIRQACLQGVYWQKNNVAIAHLSVNLSIRQLREPEFVASVQKILEETGYSANQLEFEITEGMLIDDIVKTTETLTCLHNMGIRISVDDFGTGYSSMSYLKRLPLDILKIDRAFIKDIAEDNDDAAIAGAIIDLSRALGLEVVAEGVETANQMNFLRKRGCDEIQGYLFSPPVTPSAIEEFVKKAVGILDTNQ